MRPAKRIELAAALFGWRPHPGQMAWLMDEHPVKVAACGRRWGKTESAAVDVCTFALAFDGSVQMIVAPTYDQSRLIARTVERMLLSCPHTRRRTQITRTPYTEIRFRNSRIMARTADEDGRNLRGHAADRVVVDEAAFVRDEVIEEVLGPMLADRDGQLVMVSTPFGKNHFYRAFAAGQHVNRRYTPMNADGKDRNPDHIGANLRSSAVQRVSSFRFPSWANPHISREYIEAQRASLAERQFAVEYEAEFLDDQSSVFPWADVQAGIREEEGRAAEGARVAGIDWARYSDYTAVVILESHGSHSSHRSHVVCLDRFNRMDWESQVERAADLLCWHRVVGVAADQTSVGDPVTEMLCRKLWEERGLGAEIEGVVFNAQTKRELMDNLALRLSRREVSYPRLEPLIEELKLYEYEVTPSGNVRTQARRGYHDDCVTALALALRIAPRYAGFAGMRTSGRARVSSGGW
ncbi:MAG: terminase family protein [Armatimonadetes bacterium]|nr:terminase family protein [Armatimonadota bacterium]